MTLVEVQTGRYHDFVYAGSTAEPTFSPLTNQFDLATVPPGDPHDPTDYATSKPLADHPEAVSESESELMAALAIFNDVGDRTNYQPIQFTGTWSRPDGSVAYEHTGEIPDPADFGHEVWNWYAFLVWIGRFPGEVEEPGQYMFTAETQFDSMTRFADVTDSTGGTGWIGDWGNAIKQEIEPFPVTLTATTDMTTPEPGTSLPVEVQLDLAGIATQTTNAINEIIPDWYPDYITPAVEEVVSWLEQQFGWTLGGGVPNRSVFIEESGAVSNRYLAGTTDATGHLTHSYPVPDVTGEVTLTIETERQTGNLETAAASTSITLDVGGVGGGSWFDNFFDELLAYVTALPAEFSISVSESNPTAGDTITVEGQLIYGTFTTEIENAINAVTPDWFPNVDVPNTQDVVAAIETQLGAGVGGSVQGNPVSFTASNLTGMTRIGTTDSTGRVSTTYQVPDAPGESVTLTLVADRHGDPVPTRRQEISTQIDILDVGEEPPDGGNGDRDEEGPISSQAALALLALLALSETEGS